MQEIVVDTRELPSPEPMEAVLNTLPQLREGSCVKMVHRMAPALLFPILRNNGFDYYQKSGNNGDVLIYIFLKDDSGIRKYIKGI